MKLVRVELLKHIESYSEKLIKTFKPDFKKGIVGVHHISQFDEGFLFDSCDKKIFKFHL